MYVCIDFTHSLINALIWFMLYRGTMEELCATGHSYMLSLCGSWSSLSLPSLAQTPHAQLIASGPHCDPCADPDGWCMLSGCPHVGVCPNVVSVSTSVLVSGHSLHTTGYDFTLHVTGNYVFSSPLGIAGHYPVLRNQK